MKKTTYMILAALLVLCGCSEKIFPIRGVSKANTAEVVSDEPMQAVPVVEEMPVEECAVAIDTEEEIVMIERTPIPEEWTKIKDDSLVVLESMSGELDSLLNSWYAQTFLMVDTTCTSTLCLATRCIPIAWPTSLASCP